MKLIPGLLSLSMSDGVTKEVPEIHWRLEIVGRGGIRASGLKSLSSDRVLQSQQGRKTRKDVQILSSTPNIECSYLRRSRPAKNTPRWSNEGF